MHCRSKRSRSKSAMTPSVFGVWDAPDMIRLQLETVQTGVRVTVSAASGIVSGG